MAKFDDRLDIEEQFLTDDARIYREHKKFKTNTDRSKFKKTDQKNKKHQNELQPLKKGHKRGRILEINPNAFLVADEDKQYICTLKGSFKKEKTNKKNLVTIGDFVHFNEGNLITYIEPRKSFLSRKDNLLMKKEQLIAANIDQVFICVSIHSPPLKTTLIDRYLIAAASGNLTPILLINKIDLLECKEVKERLETERIEDISKSPSEASFITSQEDLEKHITASKEFVKELINLYQGLGVKTIALSTITKKGIKELKTLLSHKTSVFSGQSGVGKSSILNLALGLDLKVGDVAKSSKGAHTTTQAKLVPVGDHGFCIDTPGIKSFGLWDIDPSSVEKYFPEINEAAKSCRYPDCKHLQEPDCNVKKSVEDGIISELRFESYCALLTEKDRPR